MSEANRQVVTRWLNEVWNERNDSTIDELLCEPCHGHGDGSPEITNRAEFRAFRDLLIGAFPNFELTIEDMVDEREHVVVRWRVGGRHAGPTLGFAATNKPVDFWGITWFSLENGKIKEGWDAWNQGGLLQRLQAPA